MTDSRIIQILKTLDKKELKLLEKFVRSPIYNQHKDVITLFDFLKSQLKKGNDSPSAEATFRAIFRKEKYEVQKLHYVNSYLTKLLEKFFSWYEWQEEENHSNLYLLRAYRRRRQDQHFERVFSKQEKDQSKETLRNRAYHLAKYRRYVEKVLVDSGRRSSQIPLQELSDAQDISFIIEKLYNACTIVSHQAVVKKEYDTGLLTPLLRHIETSNLLEIPAIAIYYYSFKALSSVDNTEAFQKLKKLLMQNQAAFTPTELRDQYVIANNFCIRQINEGKREYYREAFDLYKSGLEAEVFLNNGILSRWTYNNIAVIGLKLKEYVWVKGFITTFAEKLPEDIREGSRNLNMAYFYYETHDFEQAMQLLLQTEHDDVLHNMFGKMLLAKMYYEQSEFGVLDNLLLSFKAYITRKKGLGYHKINYLNFIKYTKKLMTVNFYDKEALEKFSAQIKDEQYLVERQWLLDRIGKLK